MSDQDGVQVVEVVGARFVDRIGGAARPRRSRRRELRSDAECVVETRSTDGAPERLYLLGATYVEGGGLERQEIEAGEPFAARHELGRWCAEPFGTGSTGQG